MIPLGNYELANMIISEGALEILQCLQKQGKASFKDLRNLKNNRTGKTFSPNTVSARLKELRKYEAITATIMDSSGRNKIVYELTESGKKALQLADKFEGELKQILKKRIKS